MTTPTAPHYLFLTTSTREPGHVGNTEWLARQAAAALPAGTPQTWHHLARMDLPPFVDQRHTTGTYAPPEGDMKTIAMVCALSIVVLRSPAVSKLKMVDLDRRAIQAARRNIEDDRAKVWWSDARTLEAKGDKDFVVSNPPFHDGGAEDRRLGQAFIRKAAELLKKGGVAWVVANRHLPYEAELNAAFKRVRLVAEAGGYKLFEAVK